MEKSADTALDNAVDEVIKEDPGSQENPRDFIERVTKKFIQEKIDRFPFMCDEAMVQNIRRQKELQEIGNKGKFTDTYGWSNDGELFEDYIIPQELYTFMNVFIYKDFWGNDNKHIWRPFMKKVCRGMIAYDAMNLFMKLKKHFGDTNLVKVN